MPKFQRIVANVLRSVCSCASDNSECTHSTTPYRQLNPTNKYGAVIIEKAEMLDPEDRAWV